MRAYRTYRIPGPEDILVSLREVVKVRAETVERARQELLLAERLEAEARRRLERAARLFGVQLGDGA